MSPTASRPRRPCERSKPKNGRSRSGCSERCCRRGSPTRSDIALAALYEAGSDVLEVGGDWYDAFELPDGRIALTVGDVVGHGLAAAAAMGQVRTALAALADHAAGPGELLERLDGFLARSGTTDFATVCYVIIDPPTGAWSTRPPVIRPCSSCLQRVRRSGSIRPNRARSAAASRALDRRNRPFSRPGLCSSSTRTGSSSAARSGSEMASSGSPPPAGPSRASPSRRSVAPSWPSSGSTPRVTTTSQ